MSQLEIVAFNFSPDVSGVRGTTCVLRAWYNRAFLTSEGNQVQGGTGTSGFYFSNPCTITNGIVTIDDNPVWWTTDDAQDPNPQSIWLSAALFTDRGAPITNGQITIAGKSQFVVPSSLAPSCTWIQFSNYAQAVSLGNAPDFFYTAAEVDQLLANITAGQVSVTGSPSSGDIAKFTSGTTISNQAETGTGSVVRATSPTLVTPTVASFANATHSHTNSAGGGQITDAALSSVVTVPKGGTGAATLTGLVKGNGASAMTAVTAPAGTVVGTSDSQTLTNKTLTAPIIATISNGGTLTLPSSTDTLVGRATTDTLTNKTLTSPVISTISNTGTLTLPTSTDTLVGRATTDTLTNKTLTSAVLTTPTLGVASATSVNKVAITAPASSATLTIADGKTLTANRTLTLTGTDSTTMTFPATSATIARTDAANTFTGNQTFSDLVIQTEGAALTVSSNTIAPTDSIHQVGAGLIKTITVPSGFTSGTIALIPTAAFTYDATGNVLGTGTATVGRTMFATYSSSTSKWSMSY